MKNLMPHTLILNGWNWSYRLVPRGITYRRRVALIAKEVLVRAFWRLQGRCKHVLVPGETYCALCTRTIVTGRV